MATVTKSIGTTSRDFSTITLWEADLDDDPTYDAGDVAIGECFDDSVFDEATAINGGSTIGLNSITLTVASGQRHDGTAGTGARNVRTAGADNTINATTTVLFNLEWLEFDANDNVGAIFINADNLIGDSVWSKLLVHNIVDTNAAKAIKVHSDPDNTAIHYLVNSFIFNIESSNSSFDCFGIDVDNEEGQILNVTVHDVRFTNVSPSGNCFGVFCNDTGRHTIKNTMVTSTDGNGTSGNEADYSIASPSFTVVNNNLASDTSAFGTGSLDNKAATDQFVSTTRGSEDLHLKSGSDAIDAGADLGTTPSGVEIDIDDRDRDAEDDIWDMGADEFVAAVIAADSIWPILWRRRRR